MPCLSVDTAIPHDHTCFREMHPSMPPHNIVACQHQSVTVVNAFQSTGE